MNYQESVAYLLSLVRPESKPAQRHAIGQRAVQTLLARLKDPHRSFKVIHLAGSKGKGSSAHYVEAILRGAGLKTGLFTSPHLVDWTERVRIDGRPIPPSRFARAVAAVRAVAPSAVSAVASTSMPTGATFFDVLTAAACWEFARCNVDVAVVEAGLGGRFDATNIFEPAACVITTLELEHTDRLGQRIETIAWHKAGIARPGKPLLVGRIPPAAHRVVSMEAHALGSPLFDCDHFFSAQPCVIPSGVSFGYTHAGLSLRLELQCPAVHAAHNACLALAAVQLSELVSTPLLHRTAAQSLANCTPPGRLQLLPGIPPLLIDAAHTQASGQALALLIKSLAPDSLRLVLSSSRHVIAPALLEIASHAERIHVVEAEKLRSLSPPALEAILKHAGISTPITRCTDMRAALRSASAHAGERSLVCVTGSTYAAGAALGVLHKRPAGGGNSWRLALQADHQ